MAQADPPSTRPDRLEAFEPRPRPAFHWAHLATLPWNAPAGPTTVQEYWRVPARGSNIRTDAELRRAGELITIGDEDFLIYHLPVKALGELPEAERLAIMAKRRRGLRDRLRRAAAVNHVFGPMKGLRSDTRAQFQGVQIDSGVLDGITAIHGRFSEATINDARFNQSVTFGPAAEFDLVRFEGPAEFDGCLFRSVSFNRAIFKDEASFADCRFEHQATFLETAFGGHANFRRARFAHAAFFHDALFFHGARFDDAYLDIGEFTRAMFMGKSRFSDSVFGRAAAFNHAYIAGGSKFDDARFGLHSTFEHAKFGGGFETDTTGLSDPDPRVEIDFSMTVFDAWATFEGAKFAVAVDFVACQFGHHATFANAVFEGHAQFALSKWGRQISFSGARFVRRVNFSGGEITKPDGVAVVEPPLARGAAAAPTGDGLWDADDPPKPIVAAAGSGSSIFLEADFSNAAFQDDADFQNRTFQEAATFSRSVWGGRPIFHGAKFRDDVSFDGARFPAVEADLWPEPWQNRFRSWARDWGLRGRTATGFATLDDYKQERRRRVSAGIPPLEPRGLRALRWRLSWTPERQTATGFESYRAMRWSTSGLEAHFANLERAYGSLRSAYKTMGNNRGEARFFRLQQLARQRRLDDLEVSGFERSLSRLYGLASSHGDSMVRPLVGWLVLSVVWVVGMWAFSVGIDGVLDRMPGQLSRGIDPDFASSVQLTLQAAFKPFEVWSSTFGRPAAVGGTATDPTAFAGWAASLMTHSPLIVRVAMSIYSISSLTLLFLFGLAVRRRFQVQ